MTKEQAQEELELLAAWVKMAEQIKEDLEDAAWACGCQAWCGPTESLELSTLVRRTELRRHRLESLLVEMGG